MNDISRAAMAAFHELDPEGLANASTGALQAGLLAHAEGASSEEVLLPVLEAWRLMARARAAWVAECVIDDFGSPALQPLACATGTLREGEQIFEPIALGDIPEGVLTRALRLALPQWLDPEVEDPAACGLPPEVAAHGGILAWPLSRTGEVIGLAVLAGAAPDPAGGSNALLQGGAKSIAALLGCERDRRERRSLFEGVSRLDAQNRRLMSIANLSFCAIAVLDTEGRIEWVNGAYERTTGYSLDDLRGRTSSEVLDGPGTDPHAAQLLARALRVSEATRGIEILRHARDGTPFWAMVELAPVDNDRGELVNFVEVTSDVTELKRASERAEAAMESQRELNARLQQSVAELEEIGARDAQLGEMRDLLHTCQTTEEVIRVARYFLPHLLPGSGGALYFLRNQRNVLEASLSWGESGLGESVFAPDACWALRRGKPHYVNDVGVGMRCRHTDPASSGGTLCMPMSPSGDAQGMLHVQFEGTGAERNLPRAHYDFFRAVAENLQLALSNARLRENLAQQAIRDPLTGAVNRRHFEDAFERELRRCARKERNVSVLMLDVDHFKRFNDTYGHEAGDLVLRQVVDAIGEVVRAEDLVCRYGGEEFVVLLPETEPEVALRRAEQIRAGIEGKKLEFRNQSLGELTVSIGCATYPENGESPDSLLRGADAALYRAKHAGRNRVEMAQAFVATG
jgi:diguanylate cyclase (GGDEF)-like protein/PAS domain S-box-containing protein